MKKLFTVSLLAAATAVATPALACDDYGRLNVPRDQWLSVPEMIEKLGQQGYKVYEIEVDDGAYEFEATTENGVRVEACAHPATGEILKGRR